MLHASVKETPPLSFKDDKFLGISLSLKEQATIQNCKLPSCKKLINVTGIVVVYV